MDVARSVQTVAPNLEAGILWALIYADLFDYPLTVQEIHRYLVGYTAPLASIEERLAHHLLLRQQLDAVAPYWFLAGRGHLVDLRREREAYSQVLWPAAWRYGSLIAILPFVRLVAISGSLAMNNVSSPLDDIDYLIVARQGRVWLTRALILLVVHLAKRLKVYLCPNYVVSENRLQLDELDLFTAHELAQLVPLHGLSLYRRMLDSNPGITQYLPNALPRHPMGREIGLAGRAGQRVLEMFLRGRLGDAIERWERERKVARLRREAAQRSDAETRFSPDMCKGHMDSHGALIQQLYAERLKAQGIGI